MKALVLAGGSGTRLRPLTRHLPKQLIPVAGRPVLEHVMENIRALGIREIGLIVGDWRERIESVVGDGSRFGARVTYLPQRSPLGLAHCVRIARPFLGDDDFVMYLGDNIVEDGVAEMAEEFAARGSDAHLAVAKVADPRAFGVAELGADGAVLRLVEKPSRPRSDLALIGVYFFRAAVHRAVAATTPSARGELEITDAVQWMLEQGGTVTAGEYAGYWQDTGSPEELLACNRRLLASLEARSAGWTDAGSRLTGPVVVGEGARVTRSHITGPAVIGAGAVVTDCRLGPGVSVGRDCVLRGVELADCVLLDGTTVTDRSGLRGLLVGAGCWAGAGGTGGSGTPGRLAGGELLEMPA